MVTIQSLMAWFSTDLARWTIRFVILRSTSTLILKILWRKTLKRMSMIGILCTTMVGILWTTIVIEPASSSASIEMIPAPSFSRTMILRLILRGATSLAVWGIWGKHYKRVRNWIWVFSYSLLFTLQHNCKLLISDRITLSSNCWAEVSKFPRESSEHYTNQFFIVHNNTNSQKFISSNLDFLQEVVYRIITFLETLQLKLKVQDICSRSGGEPLFQSTPNFPWTCDTNNKWENLWWQSRINQGKQSFIPDLPSLESRFTTEVVFPTLSSI